MATKEFDELALDGSNYPTWASEDIACISWSFGYNLGTPRWGYRARKENLYCFGFATIYIS